MRKRQRSDDRGVRQSPEVVIELPRKRQCIEDKAVNVSEEKREPSTGTSEAQLHSSDVHLQQRDTKRRHFSYIAAPGPAYPLSAYQSWEPQVTISRESDAVWALKEAHDMLHSGSAEKPEYTYFELSHFSIYRPKSGGTLNRHGGELVALDRLLRHRDGCDNFLLDGVLSCGDKDYQVRGVPFSTLTVDGYGDIDTFSLDDKFCVQSREAGLRDVWYQLGTPAPEYCRFYEPFLWLAHFTKCFVEYLLETEQVTFLHFGRDAQFTFWLQERYDGHAGYQAWLAEANLQDYRSTVAANVGFLHKECYSIDRADPDAGLCEQPIWGEVDPVNLTAIPEQPNLYKRTVVTPFAYDCFRPMYFASQLNEMPITNPVVRELVRKRKKTMNLTPIDTMGVRELALRTPESLVSDDIENTPGGQDPIDVRVGDVVSVVPDTSGQWKSSTYIWYVYVQSLRETKEGQVLLNVLWLYQPGDTTLGTAYYPFTNELFLSDNCSCGHEAISLDSVIDRVKIDWYVNDPASTSGLFVRQKFRTVHEEDSYSFETLKRSDFRCSCQHSIDPWDDCLGKYSIGDTVLVLQRGANGVRGRALSTTTDSDDSHDSNRDQEAASEGWSNSAKWLKQQAHDRLEPAVIVAFIDDEFRVVVRRLQHKSEADDKAEPNELILSDEVSHTGPERIIRKCHVRFFDKRDIWDKRIPAPYNQGGAVDCYYVARESIGSDLISDASTASAVIGENQVPHAFNEGWDPTAPTRKLRGMGIFCGGGNLDHGLEDGGAVEFDYAVDWAEHALHSYRVNSRNPNAYYFLGSVNNYLAAAIAGSTAPYIAAVGAICVLAAGSPCPGFSQLQINKLSEDSLRNASMVASVISYVDLYNPEYFVLENVVTMTQRMGASKKENVFSQVLAALVALGYQGTY